MAYSTDLGIIEAFDSYYNESYYAWDPLFPEADKDLRYFLGDQHDEATKKALFAEGRNPLVINKIRPVINMITGYQAQHRLSSIVVPVEDSDQKTADQLSQVMLHVMAHGDGYQMISNCFRGGVKTGWNLCSVWMDYREDPINGDIRFAREPWNGFIIDPYLTRLDLSDCSYLMRRKYLGVDLVASLLPGQEDEVYALHRIGWERDDKFTWLPYQRQPNGQDLMAYNEFYMQRWEPQKVLVDMETGNYQDWDGDKELFQKLKAINPNVELTTRQKRYIEMHIIVNDQVMRTENNPYGLDEYPFALCPAIWEPESDQWGLKVQSLIRCMRDPQDQINRRALQMTDLVESQINSGWLAKEGSVINPRSLFQASQGKVVWRSGSSEPGDVDKIPPAQIPQGFFQLKEMYEGDLQFIAGVNDASFGAQESGNESASLVLLRQSAALTNLQDVFDNLRSFQKHLSLLTLKLIQKWTPQKIQRIINEEPTQEFFNEEFTKYDCVVQEGLLTDTQRQMHFQQLVELKDLGAPVTGEQLARAAPIQGGAKYIEEIGQMEQQQAQQAQKQEELQLALVQSQLELAKAQAINQVASGKERFTRAVANMGLEDERSSEAIQNRTQAVLDQARAIKELDDVDIKTAKEELMLAALLREQNRQEEEQLKADDVAISATGGQPQGAVNQNQEAQNAQI